MKIDQPFRRVARSPTFVARVAPSGARMQTRSPSITSRLASHAIRLIRWRVSSNDHCHSPFASNCRRLCSAHQCIDEILCSIGDFAIDNTSWPAALLRENPAT
jgi:hypothetical protein